MLDSSALLAVMFGEPGAAAVVPHLDSALMQAVNLAEVLGRLVRDGRALTWARERVAAFGIEIVPLSERLAGIAASMVPITRPLGLSLADRCCLALAIDEGAPALTADRIWLGVTLGVRIELIR